MMLDVSMPDEPSMMHTNLGDAELQPELGPIVVVQDRSEGVLLQRIADLPRGHPHLNSSSGKSAKCTGTKYTRQVLFIFLFCKPKVKYYVLFSVLALISDTGD
jgi:hypothetical protein